MLNFTNHSSSDWSFSQLESAIERWDTVVDIPFPDVHPDFDEDQIIQLAETIVKKAVVLHPDAVLCQGEMTLAFSFVHMFHAYGIPVYAATSCRQSKEEVTEDGETQKQSIFRFVKFRKYPVIETG